MKLITHYMTHNVCYINKQRITPRGIMVHSTGAKNPYIKRYVSNDLGNQIGLNNFANYWDRPGVEKAVHAFIGYLKDGKTVAVCNCLPYYIKAWHCGGSANSTHIAFEMCEFDKAGYFYNVYQAAVEYCAHLCKVFGWDPLKDGVIVSHKEGHDRGIASDHADCDSWFKQYGYTMDMFRQDVYKKMLTIHLGDDNMNVEEYRKELQSKEGSEWSEEAREWAIDKGIITGSADINGNRNYMWQDFMTREQLVQVLYRLYHIET